MMKDHPTIENIMRQVGEEEERTCEKHGPQIHTLIAKRPFRVAGGGFLVDVLWMCRECELVAGRELAEYARETRAKALAALERKR